MTLHDNSLSMSQIAEDGEADYYEWLADQEAKATAGRIIAGELTFAEAAASLLRGEKP